VVTFVTLLMMGTLFGIVLRGSRTIAAQREALEERVSALSELLRQNEALRERVQRASSRASELNERYLRRISAELHDGPAQHLALASLRLDSLTRTLVEPTGEDDAGRDVVVVRAALADALDDIRNICKGLTLPELDELSLSTVVDRVTSSHERRTGTNVSVVIDDRCDRAHVARSVKICLYRFVQEALSNATRHAGGIGQEVSCRMSDGMLEVVVSDGGEGIPPAGAAPGGGLGLAGLRERIESLGGRFSIDTAPGTGTRLTMRLALSARESADD
jgi:signal transduction histidine kinase